MDPVLGEELAPDQPERQALSKKDIKGFGSYKLICGGLTFIVLTVGIFWYQFYQIPAGTRAPVWGQLQWDYLFWLLLFLPIEPFASGLRMWVIARVLKPGVSLWTCVKAECANIGVAILTPSQTGGGVGQIYMLSRGGLSLGTALTATLISFLGSVVVLLFIGIHSLLIAKVDRLGIFFQGAFFIFFLIFALLLLVLFWPGSLRFLISGINRGIQKICGKTLSRKNISLPQNSPRVRLMDFLNDQSQKLIDLCYLHQKNMHRFFNLNRFSFLWICLLSLVFMLARCFIAFLCLRFLGIEAPRLGNVIETQLNLIFLIYFAPTPGSSGLAEGASMLIMDSFIPTGFVPYYHLLWRTSTLYLPAVAGLLFLSWAIFKHARKAVGR